MQLIAQIVQLQIPPLQEAPQTQQQQKQQTQQQQKQQTQQQPPPTPQVLMAMKQARASL